MRAISFECQTQKILITDFIMIPNIPDFSNLEVIGRGAFSTVYRGVYEKAHQMVALKAIAKCGSSESSIRKEIELHRSLDHPLIAEYYGTIDLPEQTVMVMEYVKGYSLLDSLNQTGCCQESEAQKIFCQIVSAVKYLHGRNIAHRDLKLENILLTFQRDIKLIDFGFSAAVNGLLTTQCASFPYAAPELFNGDGYTEKVDIWALGVILFGMLVGELPFGDGDLRSISENVRDKEPNYPDFLSAPVVNLMKLMLNKDQHKRLSIDQVEKHPWLQGTRYAIIMDPSVVLAPNIIVLPPGEEVDEAVLGSMQKIGFTVVGLDMQYMRDNDDDVTLVYRMLKRASMFQDLRRMFHSVIFPQLSATANCNVAGSYLPKLKTGALNPQDKRRVAPGGRKFMGLMGKKPGPPVPAVPAPSPPPAPGTGASTPQAPVEEETAPETVEMPGSGGATPRSSRVTVENPNSRRFRPLMKNLMPLKTKRQALPALVPQGEGAAARPQAPADVLAKTSFNLSVFKQLA